MKRLLYALGIIVMIGAIVLVGYLVRPKFTSPTPNESGESTGSTETFPENTNSQTAGTDSSNTESSEENDVVSLDALAQTEKKFGVLYGEEVLAFRSVTSTRFLVMKKTGEIIDVAQGDEIVLSSAPVQNLIRASFSFDGAFVLATVATEQGEQLSMFNTKDKTWSLLPPAARTGVWAPTTNTLAFTEDDGKALRVVTWDAKLPVERRTTLYTISAFDLLLDWPAPTKIILTEKPSNRIKNRIFVLDTVTKTLASFGDAEYGLLSMWSPSAKQVIALTSASQVTGGTLTLRTSSGGVLKTLNFLTMPQKCTFFLETTAIASSSSKATSTVSENLRCAVPRSASTFARTILPDGYLMREAFTNDDLYNVDVSRGTFEILPIPSDVDVDISELQQTGRFVLFINRLDNKLYFVLVD